MKFTDEQARQICAGMRRCLDFPDWRRANLAVPARAPWRERIAFESSAEAALSQIEVLPRHPDRPGAVAEAMRDWIQQYVTPDGWRRYQDAERQRRSKKGRDCTQVVVDRYASQHLGQLALKVGLDKQVTLSHVLSYLTGGSPNALDAVREIREIAQWQQRTVGNEMLAEVFGLDAQAVERTIRECERERQQRSGPDTHLRDPIEWSLLAFHAGSSALRRLARGADREAPPHDQLKAALSRLEELAAG